MSDRTRLLTDWLFRGLMFEAEAEKFRDAGLRVGADMKHTEADLLEETLAPFGVGLRNEALQMSRLYALMYCFENSVRGLIQQRLSENHGDSWWEDKVPPKVKDFSKSRQEKDAENSWLEGERREAISFIEFGHLADIIIARWEDFEDLIPNQHWIKQKMDELEKVRNYLAHNRMLMPTEFQRSELYVADWNRQVGI